MLKKLRAKWRWWLINKLNENPEYCWAELVTWALDFKPYRELKDCKHLFCPGSGQGAYCGKCEVTRKMREAN